MCLVLLFNIIFGISTYISATVIEMILIAVQYSIVRIIYLPISLLGFGANYKFWLLWLLLLWSMSYDKYFFLEHIDLSVKFLIIYSALVGTANELSNVFISMYTPTITVREIQLSYILTKLGVAFLFHFCHSVEWVVV